MDLEARSLQPSAKALCLSKLREYKSDLNQLKKDFKRVSSPYANQSTCEELMEPGMADVHAMPESLHYCCPSRNQLIRWEICSVVEILSQQRQTLLYAHTKGLNDAIDKSKKVLTAMSRRIRRNKWIVGL
ncbi:hypothetical protein Bca4012_100337 [Brassica carinata]|uniref:Vesicle transport v-SNARE N-terminal domain-containing protein n=2 Tax=Brassica TaxID=3705 RepID=A0ABQ7Z2S0_BRANA|nr:vesicle transport v-SNARE 12-like [Brassica napus]KAG2252744.1 hypothetical protein Bca52824_082880 [Brassica carinata]KAH0874497.1 hypothetical protein HID58_071859 [Brassica napus]